MNKNDLVSEVHQIREEHAKKNNFDLNKIAHEIRKGEEDLRKNGWNVITKKANKSFKSNAG